MCVFQIGVKALANIAGARQQYHHDNAKPYAVARDISRSSGVAKILPNKPCPYCPDGKQSEKNFPRIFIH